MRNYILVFLFLMLTTGCAQAISYPDERKKAISPAEIFHSITHLQSIKSPNIYSPKSVIFSRDGENFMINSLEGMKTVIFDAYTLAEKGVIEHKFSEVDAPLFQNEDRIFDYDYYILPKSGLTNCFEGKPVEFALSHEGKYLWVSYYRRNFDAKATSPSAIAVIDTKIMKPVRIMPAGAIPKMLVPSPDGKTMAVINWGDNTIALIDISAPDASDFYYVKQFADGKKLDLAGIGGDRDSNCGYCLRGASFSPDSRYLFVGRMRGGAFRYLMLAAAKKSGRSTGYLPPQGTSLLMDPGFSFHPIPAAMSAKLTSTRQSLTCGQAPQAQSL